MEKIFHNSRIMQKFVENVCNVYSMYTMIKQMKLTNHTYLKLDIEFTLNATVNIIIYRIKITNILIVFNSPNTI